MWPYVKVTYNGSGRNEDGYIKWDHKIKENPAYFVFENENSEIKFLKAGVIRVVAVIEFPNGNQYMEIRINNEAKTRNHSYGITSNEIFEINMNDKIQIWANEDPYGDNALITRLQIEMLSVF